MDKKVGSANRLDRASPVINGERGRRQREQLKRRKARRGRQQPGEPIDGLAEDQEKVVLSQSPPKAAEPREQDIEEEEAPSSDAGKVDVYV